VLGFGLPAPVRALLGAVQHRRTLTAGDRSLARRVHSALGNSPTRGLSLYVNNGAVSVYGSVADDAAREGVLAVLAAQPGVRRIVDHLTLADA
jgi:osmotically-inducible protein OsmY